VIAGEDYKRAAGMIEARAHRQAPVEGDASDRVLRLAWNLSRIAAVPTPDLAGQLADALLEICGPSGAVSLQLGRYEEHGGWRSEATAMAARPSVRSTPARRVLVLPWHEFELDEHGPSFLVRQPARSEPWLSSIEPIHQALGATVQLAALATNGRPGSIMLAVQVGRFSAQPTGPSASLLALVLPWAHAIASHALGELPGQEPRSWLTPRESEVLGRLTQGMSVNQIAEALGRSPFTVHDHVKSLHRKLGVSRRAALVSCATVGVGPP